MTDPFDRSALLDEAYNFKSFRPSDALGRVLKLEREDFEALFEVSGLRRFNVMADISGRFFDAGIGMENGLVLVQVQQVPSLDAVEAALKAQYDMVSAPLTGLEAVRTRSADVLVRSSSKDISAVGSRGDIIVSATNRDGTPASETVIKTLTYIFESK